MKELYSIKSGAYKTSKDYARLKELLDAGHYVVCFIHYAPQGTQYEFQDICIANKRKDGYELQQIADAGHTGLKSKRTFTILPKTRC